MECGLPRYVASVKRIILTQSLHEAALALAASGVPVFPCLPRTKVPAVAKGFMAATTDISTINAWWTDEPNYNVALSPEDAGLCVIDLDKGSVGRDAWAMLEIENGETQTYEVETPSGGLHLYYRGSLPPSRGVLGTGIDTRGRGSYVLAPPSFVDDGKSGPGYYARRAGSPDAKSVPVWVEPHLAKPRERSATQQEGDTPQNIARAKAFLRDRAPAIEGEGGDDWTFVTACCLKDLGVSEETACDLMADWNDTCDPPWLYADLWIKVASAYGPGRQNEPGSAGVTSSEDSFAASVAALDDLDDSPPAPAGRKLVFKVWTTGEIALEPEPEWLIEGVMQEGAVGMMYAPPKSLKTFTTIAMLMPIALTRTVVYVAEGSRNFSKRVDAWCDANGVDRGAHHLKIIRTAPQTVVESVSMRVFVEDLKAQGIDPALVVIDTAARSMVGLDESSAKDAGLFVSAMDFIRASFDCSVLIIHHTGKDPTKGGRGSSALLGAWDFDLELKRDGNYAAVYVRHQRDAAERDAPLCFEGQRVVDQLAMAPISYAEFKAATNKEADDGLSGKAVGVALKVLGAVGGEWVTTDVLAIEIAGPDATKEQVGLTARALRARSKDRLAAYCTGDSAQRAWSLP